MLLTPPPCIAVKLKHVSFESLADFIRWHRDDAILTYTGKLNIYSYRATGRTPVDR